MSLVADLDKAYARLAEAGPKVSALIRSVRDHIPTEVYDSLMTELCGLAAGTNEVKLAIAVARMTGEVEQKPAPVTAEKLELAGCTSAAGAEPPLPSLFPRRAVEPPGPAFRYALHAAGDHTLDEEGERA